VQADLAEGLELVLTLYHNQLKHGVEIIRHYEDVPLVSCYPDELNQVWTNLLHNAVQAMEGRGTLELAVSRQDGHVSVQITDSGCGIPEDVQQKIFEPFFTTKPVGEGLGLSLAICSQIIVQRHQGELECSTLPDKGTQFTIRLPLGKNQNS
jgi:signal transduction histidine kinase